MTNVVQFVGRGEWIFVAKVSKLWRESYREVEPEKKTTFSARYRTVSRLKLSHCNSPAGLSSAKGRLGRFAGSIEVLLAARYLGMEWDEEICYGAAKEGRLDLLQSLHLKHGCPLGAAIGWHAARAPTPNILQWLNGIKPCDYWWNQQGMRKMMYCAAIHGRIENGRWLRACGGADWHEQTISRAAHHNQLAFIQWARGIERCSWGWWPDHRSCNRMKNDSHCADMFDWLHDQEDFPCNCR